MRSQRDMTAQNNYLFEPEPARWGLRGDPYLWRELKEAAGQKEKIISGEELAHFLASTVDSIIEDKLCNKEIHYLARYDPGSGLSKGKISTLFWLHTGFPLIMSRFHDAQ